MESLKTVFRGILLGVGFSFGALLIYTVDQHFIEAPSRMGFRQSLINEIDEELKQLSAEVIDYKLIGGNVYVTSKVKNTGSKAQIYVFPKIEFLDNSDIFLFDCSGEPFKLLKGGGEAYYSTECRVLVPDKLKRTARVQVKPLSAR